MKRMVTIVIGLLLLAMIASVYTPAQEAKPGPACSNAKLAGDWAFQGKGIANGLDAINVGTLHRAKDGTVSMHGWTNVGGNIFVEVNRTGGSTDNGDCTFTAFWDDGGPTAKCVVSDDGNEMWCIYDQPLFFQVTLKRIQTRN